MGIACWLIVINCGHDSRGAAGIETLPDVDSQNSCPEAKISNFSKTKRHLR